MYRVDPDCIPDDNLCVVPLSMLLKEEAVTELQEYSCQYSCAESSIGNATHFFERGTGVGTERTTADPFSGERLDCLHIILGETQLKELIVFICVEGEQEFTSEEYSKAAGNFSDELGFAVYPAGTLTTVIYFGSIIRDLCFETADRQLTSQKIENLQSMLLEGHLNMLERLVRTRGRRP